MLTARRSTMRLQHSLMQLLLCSSSSSTMTTMLKLPRSNRKEACQDFQPPYIYIKHTYTHQRYAACNAVTTDDPQRNFDHAPEATQRVQGRCCRHQRNLQQNELMSLRQQAVQHRANGPAAQHVGALRETPCFATMATLAMIVTAVQR